MTEGSGFLFYCLDKGAAIFNTNRVELPPMGFTLNYVTELNGDN